MTPSKKKLLSEWSIRGPASLARLRLSEGADEGFPTLKSSQSQTKQTTQPLSFWVGGEKSPRTDGLGRELGDEAGLADNHYWFPCISRTPHDKELPRTSEHSDHWLLKVSFPGMVL